MPILAHPKFASVFSFPDAFGLRLVHGEIPGSSGRYGCVISHIFAGSFIEAIGDIHEGDEVVQINGIPMAEKSDNEIQLIVGAIREDRMELSTRSYSTRNHLGIEMNNHVNYRSGMNFNAGGAASAFASASGKGNVVEFGPVNEWCFDEESWPGPRTGEVSSRKAFEDDRALMDRKGYRTTLAPTGAVAAGKIPSTKTLTLMLKEFQLAES